MNIIQLVHTSIQFEPASFNLGKLLVDQGHHLVLIGYWLPQLELNQVISPGYEVVRVDRGDWGLLPRLLRGALRFLKYSTKVKKIFDEASTDMIIATNYDTLVLAHLISNKDIPVVYYCTEYTPKPKMKNFLSGWGFLKVLEPIFVRKSNFLVSVDENRAILQAKDWAIDINSIILNTPIYDPLIEGEALKAIEDRNKNIIRIIYAGSIDKRNQLEEFMQIVCEIPFVEFHIYGKIVNRYYERFSSELKKFRTRSSNRIKYLGTIPYIELPAILMKYDIGLCFYDKSSINTVYASPAKIFEYMKAGLIIFSTDQPTPMKIIGNIGGGYIFHDREIKFISTVLDDLIEDPNMIRDMRKANLNSFKDEFNYSCQAKDLVNWINSQNSSTKKRL